MVFETPTERTAQNLARNLRGRIPRRYRVLHIGHRVVVCNLIGWGAAEVEDLARAVALRYAATEVTP